MAIEDVWLHNLRALVQQEQAAHHGNIRAGYRAVADRSTLSVEYVYQLATGQPKKGGAPRQVGKDAAKKLAKAYADGRPDDWFNVPMASAAPAATPAPAPNCQQLQEPQAAYALPSDDQILEQMGMLLARVPDNMRGSVAAILGEWARAGGTGASPSAVLALLGAQAKRRQFTR